MNCTQGRGGTVWQGLQRWMGILAAILFTGASAFAQPIVYVEEGDSWMYFKGFEEPPADWADPGFDDFGWLEGPTGIGYGDGDDATELLDMQNTYVSFYARREFNASGVASLERLHLHIDWDDGFIAYLNGQEIARRNMGNPGDFVAFDVTSTAGHEANGFVAIDIGTAAIAEGDNVLAIQLHNTTLDSSDASLIPRLVGNINLPPNGVTCQRVGNDVELTWTNQIDYDSIRIERDGVELDTIAGDSTDYTDFGHDGMDVSYQIIGLADGEELASGTCNLGCTQGFVTCTLDLVGGATQGTLTWSDPPAGVASIDIEREGALLETIDASATGYVDPDVESDEPEDDTEFDVIFNLSDGRTCTQHCGPITLCPENLTAQVVNGEMVLNWENVVKAWDVYEISRNGTVVDSLVPGDASSWIDPELVPQMGEVYDYLLHPIAVSGGELNNLDTCDLTLSVGYAPELGSYDPPAGGWDYEFDASGAVQYNPVVGETGNLDGNWIRAIDLDSWDGSEPFEAGTAPDGVAPGGIDTVSRPGLGPCGTSGTSVLRVLDPGDTTDPQPNDSLATQYPDPFTEPNNSTIVLGLDLGVVGENVLKTGVTLTARLRTTPLSEVPAYLNANGNSGDGSALSDGIGHVGVYYRDPLGGASVGASVSLYSNNNGGNIQVSTEPMMDLDAMAIYDFKTIWLTVEESVNPDIYDINVYVNGQTTPAPDVSLASALQDGEADLGVGVENYLLLGSNAGDDCMIEIDYVAYRLGVFPPSSTPCEGGGEGLFRRGDADDNGAVNITDGIFLLGYLFLGGETPPCLDAADANDDSAVSITDGIHILNALFLGGPQPLPPGPNSCGSDVNADTLAPCVSTQC